MQHTGVRGIIPALGKINFNERLREISLYKLQIIYFKLFLKVNIYSTFIEANLFSIIHELIYYLTN